MATENCKEAAYSNEYADFIFEYYSNKQEEFQRYAELCPSDLGARFGVLYVNRGRIPPLTIEEYMYMSIPKLYGLMDVTAMESSGVLQLQNQPKLMLQGQGVLIGFIDTGIDLLNPLFWDEADNSRVCAVWDQTKLDGNPPDGFYFGRDYSREEIREMVLRYQKSGIPKRRFEMQENITRDDNGHGTAMAALAAGREDKDRNFTGAAPLAELAVVKLKEAKQYLKDFYFIKNGAVAYQENDIMLAVRYLGMIAARERKPMVIVLGIGTNQGDHTGNSPLGEFLSITANTVGFCVVTAGGNEGNQRHHYSGVTVDNKSADIVELNVAENERGFTMELWGEPPDIYSISILAPGGEQSGRILPSVAKSEVVRFIFEKTVIYVNYKIVETRTGKQLIIARFENPTPGIWKIAVFNSNATLKEFHMWLPIRGFIEEETFFLRSNPDVTLVEPSNAFAPITVSGYNHHTGAVYADGSRGYTRSGQIKPDFAAPAVDVLVPDLLENYKQASGTSVAAAITAGVAAQFFTWGFTQKNQITMKTVDIKNYLIRGTRRMGNESYPNRQQGYGKLDGYYAFEVLI